ncbi:MAG: hypothetical protein IT378_12675 [Sandaracinaceae bacterium]|nr:hypothetical protein [Sandaracinaceae bacterium]
MSESKKSESDPAASALAQQLLSQIQHDFVAAPAAEKQRAAQTAEALLGQLQDFVVKEQQKKEAASHLANALLHKVSRDFGSIPPPQSAVTSAPVQSDAELEAAAQSSTLSEQELAELDAMTAPTGFWGKLVARLRGKRAAR